MASPELVAGARVVITGKEDLGKGVLRFIGETKFRPGVWAGIELAVPQGKNNGTVQGVKYFTCKDKHGIFVPATSVVAVPKSSVAKRPSTTAKRASVSGHSSPTSVPASPTPARKQVDDKAAEDTAAAEKAAAEKAAAVQAAAEKDAAEKAAAAAAQAAAAQKATAEKAAEEQRQKAAAARAAADAAAAEKAAADQAAAEKLAAEQEAATKAAAAERAAAEKAAAEHAAAEKKAAAEAARAAANAEASAAIKKAETAAAEQAQAAERERAAAEKAKAAAEAAAAAAEEDRAGALRQVQEAEAEKAAAALAKAEAARLAKQAEEEKAAAERATAEAAHRAEEASREQQEAAERAAAAEKEKAKAEQARAEAAEVAAEAEKQKELAEKRAATIAKEKELAEQENAKAQKAREIAEAKMAAIAEEKAAAEKARAAAMEQSQAAEARAATVEKEKLEAERLRVEAQKARKAAEARANTEAKERAEAEAAASKAEQELAQQKLAMADFQTTSKALQLEVEQLRAEVEELRSAKSTSADSAKERLAAETRARKEAEEQLQAQAKEISNLKKEKDKVKAAAEKELEKVTSQFKKEVSALKEKLEDMEITMEELKVDLEMAEEATALAEQTSEQLKGRLEIAEAQSVSRSTSADEPAEASDEQLKENNERLTIALMKLRDLSISEKQERDKRIKELEREANQLPKLEEKILQLETECLQAEENVEELKEQLDVALEAAEVVDELTEKNMDLEDTVRDLRLTIEDLEEMRDLSEELESQQAETEKQLRKELRLTEVKLQDQETVIGNVVAKIKDQEETILKYRSKVDDLKANLFKYTSSEQEKLQEADSLETKASRLLEENISMRNQLSKLSGAVIEKEIGELEQRNSAWKLQQLEAFVPTDLIAGDKEGVECHFLLRRLVDKSKFVAEKVKAEHHIHDFIIATVSDRNADDRYFGYKIARLLDSLSLLTSQLLLSMECCSDEHQWAAMSKMQWDLSSNMRVLDSLIGTLKSGDLPLSYDLKPLEDAVAAAKSVGQRYNALCGVFTCTEALQAMAYGCQFMLIEHQLLQRRVAHNLQVAEGESASAAVGELCQTDAFRAAVKEILDVVKQAYRALEKPAIALSDGEDVSALAQAVAAARSRCASLLQSLHSVKSTVDSAVSDLDAEARSVADMSSLLGEALKVAFPVPEAAEPESESFWSSCLDSARQLAQVMAGCAQSASLLSISRDGSADGDRAAPALLKRATTTRNELNSLSSLKSQLEEQRQLLEAQVSKISSLDSDVAEGQRARTLLEGRISSLLSREEELQRCLSEKEEELVKQAKTWEDALVSLQEDLDAAESENRELADKLAQGRKTASSAARGLSLSSSSGTLSAQSSGVNSVELAIASEFLQRENSFLRSQVAAARMRRLQLQPLPRVAAEPAKISQCRQQLLRIKQAALAMRACPVVIDLAEEGKAAAARLKELTLLSMDAARLRTAVSQVLGPSMQFEGVSSAPELVNGSSLVGRLKLPAPKVARPASVCALQLEPCDLHTIHSQLA